MRIDYEIELEKEYNRFIEFGHILNKRMRTYLVQYIRNKFDTNRFLIPELNEQYYIYFTGALDRIFSIQSLFELTADNIHLKYQIIHDILYFLKKAYKNVRVKNPFADEKLRLEGWSVTPFFTFLHRYPALIKYLSEQYHRSEIDTQFFKSKFDQLINHQSAENYTQEEKEKIEMFIHDILAQWDALLYAKILEFQLLKFEEEENNYTDLLEKKIKEYNKIKSYINPISNYLGWDFSRKLWQESSFNIIQHYESLLEKEESVKALADLLGGMREAEIEMEEETFKKTIIRQQWQTDEDRKAEIVGVKESDELSNLLSSEVQLMSDSDLEYLFLKKYADKKLLTFKFEDRKLVKSEDHYVEVNQRVREKEKGPFIICVDTSESMHGTPELIAKVLSLAILKMAMHENRRAFLIIFSTGIQTLDLFDIANSIDDIAAFLKMSFYGGTDATMALTEAIRQLGTNAYADADILMVSDFIMSRLDLDIENSIKYHQQNQNTQFHCLVIGKESNENVLKVFDTNWKYDPEEKGIIRSITRGFSDIVNR